MNDPKVNIEGRAWTYEGMRRNRFTGAIGELYRSQVTGEAVFAVHGERTLPLEAQTFTDERGLEVIR